MYAGAMPSWIDHAEEFARWFEEDQGRPIPWFELVDIEDELGLVTTWRQQLRLTDAWKMMFVLKAAWEKHPDFDRVVRQAEFRGSREPLADAVARLGLQADGMVLVPERTGLGWTQSTGTRAVRMQTKHAIEFERMFWSDDECFLDADGRWMLLSQHDAESICYKRASRTR